MYGVINGWILGVDDLFQKKKVLMMYYNPAYQGMLVYLKINDNIDKFKISDFGFGFRFRVSGFGFYIHIQFGEEKKGI